MVEIPELELGGHAHDRHLAVHAQVALDPSARRARRVDDFRQHVAHRREPGGRPHRRNAQDRSGLYLELAGAGRYRSVTISATLATTNTRSFVGTPPRR